ncbi:hypothetical protein PR048_018368 [Dryococelus australis]|uniref:Uncharacterized protein n=1 Tax=Dryococelus australis TaxID=614101 RepID=A0ABQ9HC20_9NEOP|nr:hypothetical protein PR048_018368 [Dryococelus australis]
MDITEYIAASERQVNVDTEEIVTTDRDPPALGQDDNEYNENVDLGMNYDDNSNASDNPGTRPSMISDSLRRQIASCYAGFSTFQICSKSLPKALSGKNFKEILLYMKTADKRTKSILDTTLLFTTFPYRGEKLSKTILNQREEAIFYGLIVDVTPNVSHQEHGVFVLRYVFQNTETNLFEICERFIEFKNFSRKTGEAITYEILSTLETLQVPLADCHAQGYDYGSNMWGHIILDVLLGDTITTLTPLARNTVFGLKKYFGSFKRLLMSSFLAQSSVCYWPAKCHHSGLPNADKNTIEEKLQLEATTELKSSVIFPVLDFIMADLKTRFASSELICDLFSLVLTMDMALDQLKIKTKLFISKYPKDLADANDLNEEILHMKSVHGIVFHSEKDPLKLLNSIYEKNLEAIFVNLCTGIKLFSTIPVLQQNDKLPQNLVEKHNWPKLPQPFGNFRHRKLIG